MGISQPFFTRPRPATSVSASNDSPRHPRAKMGSGNLRRLWKLVRRSVTTDRAFGPFAIYHNRFRAKAWPDPDLRLGPPSYAKASEGRVAERVSAKTSANIVLFAYIGVNPLLHPR